VLSWSQYGVSKSSAKLVVAGSGATKKARTDAGARIELQRFEGLAVLVKTRDSDRGLLESSPQPALLIPISHTNPRSRA
jgi:hypothetical protein